MEIIKGAVFHHLGLAVKSIGEVDDGLEIHTDRIQNVRVALARVGGTTLEYVEPIDEESPIMANLEKGYPLHHFCLAVPNLTEALAEAEAKNFVLVSPPQPAAAFNNKKIAWIYSKTHGLIELLEN